MNLHISNLGSTFLIFDNDADVNAASAMIECYHGTWTLRKCIVHPDYRGQGLQRILISARLEYAKGKGAKRVVVWVKPTNCYSLNNLVTLGFRFMDRKMKEFDGHQHICLQYKF